VTGRASAELRPLFLDSADRRLFAFAGRPAGGTPRHGILVCPAFAEEMNRTRRTVRLLCEQGVRRGHAVLNVDLHGTGDSDGDFADARWEHWLDDLGTGAAWLRSAGCRAISLLGIRAGALAAVTLARRLEIASLLLWQPVVAGQSAVTDLLRTRVAAGAAAGERESVADLRGQLAAGATIEAAGYALPAALAAALDAAVVAGEALSAPVLWLEVASEAGAPPRAPAAQAAARLRAAGVRVELTSAVDPPFWSTTEVTVGRASVAATLDWLETCA
jgi:exosortase A-associated hydrolase 2